MSADIPTKGSVMCRKPGSELSGLRLDIALSEMDPGISRNFAQYLIISGYVFVNGRQEIRKSQRLNAEDIVEVLEYEKKSDAVPLPKKAELNILYQDEFLLVIDKPSGLTVHPGSGNTQDTLVNALLYYREMFSIRLSDMQGISRCGIVHRLDKDTSGAMLIAKENEAHLKLQGLFKERRVKKEYLAVVWGEIMPNELIIDSPIGRHPKNRLKFSSKSSFPKDAFTKVRVFSRFNGFSLIKAYPLTGRTHQIRVHMKEAGFPIVGDKVYSAKRTQSMEKYFARNSTVLRLMLHSQRILFPHPFKSDILIISSPVPADYRECLRVLRHYNG
jgi:23S rRNA pseudouridine1911/1915/1917 synthase